jgi:cytochrome c-type protein NapB
MKKTVLMSAILALSLNAGLVLAVDKGLTEEQMGLSKADVSVDAAPDVFEYGEADPYIAGVLPRAYSGAPPQIPHTMEGLVPITRELNTCLSCHQLPDRVGKKKAKGESPLPLSHYTDVKHNALYMGRYNCTQCHTPQAKVKSLVGNTFRPK